MVLRHYYYSAKLLCDHSMAHNTVLGPVSSEEEYMNAFVFRDC